MIAEICTTTSNDGISVISETVRLDLSNGDNAENEGEPGSAFDSDSEDHTTSVAGSLFVVVQVICDA